jgi:isoprenylcysteine carboxyl methyltransferase (ICMT) family protein YpbQ
MKLFILNRLYMFKTTESDMRWLQGNAGIDLGRQHQIAYQRADKKRN